MAEDNDNSSSYEYYYADYSPSERLYYDEHLLSYSEQYKFYHGYVSIIICIFGVLGNSINIVVFTRKSMISSTNIILTALAIADLLRVLLYIPYAFIYYIPVHPDLLLGFSQAYTDMVCSNSIHVAEFISVWLTVMLSVWRFIAIYWPLSAGRLLKLSRTRCIVIALYCSSVLICMPQFFGRSVFEHKNNNITLYKVDWSEVSMQNRQLEMFIYWSRALVMDILPCTLVSIFTLALIRILYRTRSQRRNLTNGTGSDPDRGRINKMLLTILLLFLFSELPNGILTVLSDILGYDFYDNVELPLWETLDIFELVNHSFNCTIYYSMILKYRETFHSIFSCGICRKANSAFWSGRSSQATHVESGRQTTSTTDGSSKTHRAATTTV